MKPVYLPSHFFATLTLFYLLHALGAFLLSVKGYDVAHIHHMLGNRTLETTQMLLTTDPVSMGAIAARAF